MIATSDRIASDGMAEFLCERSRRVVASEAYCTSEFCIEDHYKRSGATVPKYVKHGVLKGDAKKTNIDCSDCGSALFWRASEEKVYEFEPNKYSQVDFPSVQMFLEEVR